MSRFDASDGDLARLPGVKFSTVRGRECVCDLRVLSGEDDEIAIENALAFARSKGNASTVDNPLYDFALAREQVALAAVDPDSPKDHPVSYFPGGAADVRKHLHRDTIMYLAKQQQVFQERMSPLKRQFESPQEYLAAVLVAAHLKDGDADPFGEWAPSLRLSFERSMAAQLLDSPRFRSSDT